MDIPITLLLFEVLDKEPTLATYWFILSPIGLMGATISYFFRPFTAIAVIVSLIVSGVFLKEFWDVGLITSGEDWSYVLGAYAAMATSIGLPVLGLLLSRRISKQ
jgi:hypothetical protein